MYYNTRGIFLRKVKYSDTSIITGIYTEEFGLQSYIVKNIRSKRPQISPGLLQPLTLLDMVVTHREKAKLNYIKEASSASLTETLFTDIRKSAVAMFIDELLIKTVQEENSNPELFGFLFDSIKLLDTMKGNISSFHLVFALKLSRLLGFYPQGDFSEINSSFDMEGGVFTADPGMETSTYISGDDCAAFASLLSLQYQGVEGHKMNRAMRYRLLEKILLFYSLHVPTATNFKSHNILQVVFSD